MRTALIAVALAIGALASADGPITWKPIHRVGDSFDWIQSSNLFSNILPVGVETKLREQVTEEQPDGSFTTTVTQGKSRVSWAFEELATPDDEIKITYRCNGKGELISVDADPIYAEWAARSHNLEAVIAPDRAVSVGDSWTYDFAANPKTGAVTAHGVYKLVSVTDSVLTVQIDVQETEGIAPASCTGEVTLRRSDFATASFSLKLKDAAVPGLPGLGTGSLTQKPAG